MLNERDALLKKIKKPTNNKRIDEIEKTILVTFKKLFNKYEVDFIIETLTRFGQAPNVVYDDNGLFAVSSVGYQPVVTGKEKIHGSLNVFVERQQWKKSIRAALKHYLTS